MPNSVSIGDLQQILPIRVAHLDRAGLDSTSARALMRAIAWLPAESALEYERVELERGWVVTYRYAPTKLTLELRLDKRTPAQQEAWIANA